MEGLLQSQQESKNTAQVVGKTEFDGSVGTDGNQSRLALLAELSELGVDVESFHALTINQLSDLLCGLNKLMDSVHAIDQNGKVKNNDPSNKIAVLSSIDKKILRALLESEGRVATLQLSTDLDIPLSTVQRRRRRMEEELINSSVSLRYEKFARKQITFLVHANARSVIEIGREILAFDGIRTVARTLGSEGDIKVEAILKNNNEVANLCERIKTIEGVKHVSWIESIEVLGINKATDFSIIES